MARSDAAAGLPAGLDLGTRERLPDALRVLLAEHPRETWETHARFPGLVAMWMDRHLFFRHRLSLMQADARAVLGGTMDPSRWAPRLARLGGEFVEHLHGHHRIEDDHYFPLLAAREPRIERGFAILDADHQALDAHLEGFVTLANAALRAGGGAAFRTEAGRFEEGLGRLAGFLDRHLTDEEELVVPVILRDGEGSLR